MKRINSVVKSILVIQFLVFISFGCTEEEPGIPIEGKLKNKMDDGLVTLAKVDGQELKVMDTIEVNDEGEFKFYINQEHASFYRLNFFNRQMVNLIIDGSEEKVTIHLDGTDPQDIPEIKGSKDTDYFNNLVELVSYQSKQLQELNQEAIQARMSGDDEQIQALTEDYYDRSRFYQKERKEMIWKMAPSLSAYYALSALDQEENFGFIDSVSQKLIEARPDHPTSIELANMLNSMRTLSIGSMAPEIALPTPDGETLKLSSLRGKYVLIDFWAAWCRPCRVENPNVVRMYNKYKDENFEIFGVSLDRTKEAWVDAIRQDGLEWLHVSDLQYFNSAAAQLYQINAIPATYLIDPEGKIIGKNLRGASLEAKLKEIFG